MIRRMMIFLGMLAVLAVPAGNALAHTTLTASEPANGAEVAAPAMLMLEFGAAVKLARVQIVPMGGAAAGKPITLALDRAAPATTRMEVPVTETLGAGAYTVKWRAVAGDGHIMTGEFGFTVK